MKKVVNADALIREFKVPLLVRRQERKWSVNSLANGYTH